MNPLTTGLLVVAGVALAAWLLRRFSGGDGIDRETLSGQVAERASRDAGAARLRARGRVRGRGSRRVRQIAAITSDGLMFIPFEQGVQLLIPASREDWPRSSRPRRSRVAGWPACCSCGDLGAARVVRGAPGVDPWRLEALGRDREYLAWSFETEEAARAALDLLERIVVRAPTGCRRRAPGRRGCGVRGGPADRRADRAGAGDDARDGRARGAEVTLAARPARARDSPIERREGLPFLVEHWYLGSRTRRYMMVRRFREVLEHAALEPGLRVLDVGCGWAYGSHWARALGCEVCGIDLAHDQLAWARRELPGRRAPGAHAGQREGAPVPRRRLRPRLLGRDHGARLPAGPGRGLCRAGARAQAGRPARALHAQPRLAHRGGQATGGPLAGAAPAAALLVLPRGDRRPHVLPSVPLPSPAPAAELVSGLTAAGFEVLGTHPLPLGAEDAARRRCSARAAWPSARSRRCRCCGAWARRRWCGRSGAEAGMTRLLLLLEDTRRITPAASR